MSLDYNRVYCDEVNGVLESEGTFLQKLGILIERLYKTYPFKFSDSNDGISVGRSKLYDQLVEPSNYEIRDCKLVTFICANILKEAGYPVLLVTFCNGPHPFVLVPQMGNLNGYDDSLVLKISFHPGNCGMEKLKFMRKVFTWAEIQNGQVQSFLRMQSHSLTVDGVKSLDQNYINTVTEISSSLR